MRVYLNGMPLPPDIAAYLEEHGVNEPLTNLLDAVYLKGFKHGLERGLYEVGTEEDAEEHTVKLMEKIRRERQTAVDDGKQ